MLTLKCFCFQEAFIYPFITHFSLFFFNKRVFIKAVGLVAFSADNNISDIGYITKLMWTWILNDIIHQNNINFDNLKSVQSKKREIFLYENDKMKDKKKGVSVNQIDLTCSGPPLSSNMLNACMWHVVYVSTLMSLQQHGQTRPQQ